MTTTDVPTRSAVRGNPWRPSALGVWLVLRIELHRRRPSAKGWIFYALVFAGILGLGIVVAMTSGAAKTSLPLELVLVLIAAAGMLIAPSLSATSINGDSSEGVLAPLQMSRLTAGDLAIGKMLASWAVAVAALVTMTPFLVYAYVRSGWQWGELAVVLGGILLVVLMATGVGLAWSAIAARAVASVSLAHLTIGALVFGTLLLFAFLTPLTAETIEVRQRDLDYESVTDEQWNDPDFDPNTLECVDITYDHNIHHTQQIAWLLQVNPAVMVAELSPVIDPETWEEDGRAAPGLFAMIHQSVSDARLAPSQPVQDIDYCTGEGFDSDSDPWMERQLATATMQPSPWLGLATVTAIWLGSMVIAIRRLRVPYKKLRGGTRVA